MALRIDWIDNSTNEIVYTQQQYSQSSSKIWKG